MIYIFFIKEIGLNLHRKSSLVINNLTY